MADFMIRFLLCNIFISILIGMLLAARQLLKNSLTTRMQYNLWFPLLGLLFVPFIPLRPVRLLHIFSWLGTFKTAALSPVETAAGDRAVPARPDAAGWMNDFGISVSRRTPAAIGLILCILWCAGIFVMTVLILKSMSRFNALKKSALPLQNPAVHRLYRGCLDEMHITKHIPICSTAFLKSPVAAGLFRPCIYLPLHLISDYNADEIRYMLLHELGHFKYKDALAGYVMNLAGVLYWFNPFVWYALKEMKNDREAACDSSVLELLSEDAYEAYGNTLINFAQKVSRTPFPFTAGIGGNMRQMEKRIRNIADYHPASRRKKLHSAFAYILLAFPLLSSAPVLSIQAADNSRYFFREDSGNTAYIDLSAVFAEYDGSFVLFDSAGSSWQIYNKEYASVRISPASTFKIYSALFGLESGIITPEQSLIPWDGQTSAYSLWNADQTLESAMQNSVTWYFQALDRQTGLAAIKNYVRKTGYGNQLVEGSISSYWIDSTLKISPVEQVEMLKKFYYGQLEFAPENVQAVKDSIRLYSTADGTMYGKTGTQEVNGHNISGWFIGYIEKDGRTCFFATNIQNEKQASGPAAAELTFSILSDLDLWDNGRQ